MRTTILLPELTPDQYQALKADIEINGILVPIIKAETGETIDGHHREKIAIELGIAEVPVKVVPGLGEEERRHMAIRLNANRRQLTAEQKRRLIREELKRSPDISNNWLADVYSNRPFGKVFRAIEEMRAKLKPMFEAVQGDPFPREVKKGGPNISLGTIEKIQALHAAGKRVSEIMKEVGVADSTVYRHIKGLAPGEKLNTKS